MVSSASGCSTLSYTRAAGGASLIRSPWNTIGRTRRLALRATHHAARTRGAAAHHPSARAHHPLAGPAAVHRAAAIHHALARRHAFGAVGAALEHGFKGGRPPPP